MTISREDVIGAYKYILGREPESEDAINYQIKAYDNFEDLRRGFLLCEETSSQIEIFRRVGVRHTLSERFSDVYKNRLWLDDESGSGPGSRQDAPPVKASLEALKEICSKFGIASINDIPCGDFNWMRIFLDENSNFKYAGFDIVDHVIHANSIKHPHLAFYCLDITSQVPPYADLIFCKDLFNHLLYDDIRKALQNMKKSRSKFILLSNNPGATNKDLELNIGGASRMFDIKADPFNFPPPIWSMGYLEFWKLEDVP